jgi:hypothetical protein
VSDESKNVELSTARRTHPALPIVVDLAEHPDCLGWGSARAFHC